MLSKIGSVLALEAMALYLRRSPWEIGRWRLLGAAMPLARSAKREGRRRTIRTQHGFRLRVDLDDWLGQHVFVSGDYEPSTARLIKALLRPRDLFVDVGANIGFFTILASRAVGKEGAVIAFEPLPRARDELMRNLRLNGISNVVVRSEAAADRDGEAAYYAGPTDHQGCSSLRPLVESSEVLNVRTARLDDLLPTDRRIALIKLDVEGAEGRVLDGLVERLRADRPALIVEVTDSYLRGMGDSARRLCDRLFRLGYKMEIIGYRGLEPAPRKPEEFPEQFNALFTAGPFEGISHRLEPGDGIDQSSTLDSSRPGPAELDGVEPTPQ